MRLASRFKSGNYQIIMPKFASVKILLKGYFKWVGPNTCKASSTVTLVQDGKVNIIVDTGTKNNQAKLASALKKQGLKTGDIDYVIISHSHTDHLENLSFFTKAQSLNIFEIKKGDVFKISDDLLRKGERQLTPNVKLLATPGHTPECLTVLVSTAKGLIAIAGDLFVKKQEEKGVFVGDQKLFAQSRQQIIKIADYIIPGHAGIFKVNK